MKQNEKDPVDSQPEESLVLVYSYHHHNTEKIAYAIARVLNAPVKTPRDVNPGELTEYDLIGFGSGIYSAKNHESILNIASNLPQANGNATFIFSTFGAPVRLFSRERLDSFIRSNHSVLQKTLESRGYVIAGEFGCAGFNTNSLLKYLGGINKGRPNADDLRHAEEFAHSLIDRPGVENPAHRGIVRVMEGHNRAG